MSLLDSKQTGNYLRRAARRKAMEAAHLSANETLIQAIHDNKDKLAGWDRADAERLLEAYRDTGGHLTDAQWRELAAIAKGFNH